MRREIINGETAASFATSAISILAFDKRHFMIFKSSSSISSLPSTDFGKVEGYVNGPTGLPAVGTSVIAYKEIGVIDSVQKEGCFTASSFVSVDGKYSFSLPSGVYRVTVAYPDGTNDVINNYAIWPGSSSSFDFEY
jgi:hypothetical protein